MVRMFSQQRDTAFGNFRESVALVNTGKCGLPARTVVCVQFQRDSPDHPPPRDFCSDAKY